MCSNLCTYCSPSSDSWSGDLIDSTRRCRPEPDLFVGIPLIFTGLGDCLRSTTSLVCFKCSNQTKNDRLKNITSSLSVLLCGIFAPCIKVNRLTLFCKSDPTLVTQIHNCVKEHQEDFIEQLNLNPELRDMAIQVECNPDSPLVHAMKSRNYYIANYFLKHKGHRHDNSPLNKCYALEQIYKMIDFESPTLNDNPVDFVMYLFLNLLGDLYVNNYKQKRALRLQEEKKVKDFFPLACDEELEKEEADKSLTQLLVPRNNEFIFFKRLRYLLEDVNVTFCYPHNDYNLEISNSSILDFLVFNLQSDNIERLLNDGIHPDDLNDHSFTALDNIFANLDLRNYCYFSSITPWQRKQILPITKLLIRNGATFNVQDLADPNLATPMNDKILETNRYARCFNGDSLSIHRLNFWREHLEELRKESRKADKIFHRTITTILKENHLPNVLINIIVEYFKTFKLN